ncbi:hypothetical protein ACROYT_G010661 [Oculina patagonica]
MHARSLPHLSSNSLDPALQDPKCFIVIKDAFTCETTSLVYGISYRRCSAIYIAKTGHTLQQRFVERSIEKNLPGFPVAKHFNTNGHTIQDVQVRSIMLCDGNKQRKPQEKRLIFNL